MRIRLGMFAAAAFAALITMMPSAGQADPYKWCANYSGDDGGGGTNCGFVTLEQCRATISGMGGYCDRNPFYTGPAERPAKRARKLRDG